MADPPYQINGEEEILAWARDRPPEEFEAMLAWLPHLVVDPHQSARAVRNGARGVAAYTAMVPGTTAFVDYLVVEQYRTVLIKAVTNVELEDVPELPEDDADGPEESG